MERLKSFRKSLGLKSKDMAIRIGVSPSYYYKVEEDIQTPSFTFLVKLKRKFPNINIDEMFFEK